MATPVYGVTPGIPLHATGPLPQYAQQGGQPQQYQSDPTTLKRLDSAAAALARFQGKAALVVIALGLLAVALGAAGASGATVTGADGKEHVSLVAQFPYLISGGIFGLALVVVGAALVVAQSHRADAAKIVSALEQAQAARLPDDMSSLSR